LKIKKVKLELRKLKVKDKMKHEKRVFLTQGD